MKCQCIYFSRVEFTLLYFLTFKPIFRDDPVSTQFSTVYLAIHVNENVIARDIIFTIMLFKTQNCLIE